MLTIVIASWTIATSIPLGLLLALGRRSELPVISYACATFIELWRSLPLIGVLFLAVVMFPLFVPQGFESDKLVRALIAFTLFNAAIFAEVFRGGLQAIPHGQQEAARSLGLGYWRTTGLVVLPQVIRIVMPGMINTCVSIIKETTVVLIIGLIEFLAVLQIAFADPEWLIGDQVRQTGYLFAALVFWSLVLRPLALQRAARPADAGRFSPLSFLWSKQASPSHIRLDLGSPPLFACATLKKIGGSTWTSRTAQRQRAVAKTGPRASAPSATASSRSTGPSRCSKRSRRPAASARSPNCRTARISTSRPAITCSRRWCSAAMSRRCRCGAPMRSARAFIYLCNASLQVDLPARAAPFIEQINEKTGETVHLAVLQGDAMMKIAKRESRHPVRVDTGTLGKTDAPHATASGKAMLAWLPEDDMRRVLAKGLARFTPKTITEWPALIEALRHVRRNGYAMDDEEYQPGVICVGAPIRDHNGAVVGAISASTPDDAGER